MAAKKTSKANSEAYESTSKSMGPQTTRRPSVILLSGGLDSSANLAFTEFFDEPILALTLDYGQRSSRQEILAAQKIADYYQVPHRVVGLPWLGELGGSALTQKDQSLPQLKLSELDHEKVTREAAKAVWVPNRNGLFINVAAAIAESMKAAQVVVGFNKEEAATFPDNSSAFLGVSTLSLKYSTATGVKVGCYTDMMTKPEIVQALENLSLRHGYKKFPYHLVWSCYEGGSEPCNNCESCKRLERALASVKKL